ncbi:MAG TPA: hypothetical protein PKD37_04180 [Oligoflexia bacterium]|nr:hypothetical protein [Oligoflexia bacterium]HMP27165.1 hypothetical protein [Oligoflexia bacterium]
MEETATEKDTAFSLIYQGLQDGAQDAEQKIKGILIADLNLTSEQVKNILSSSNGLIMTAKSEGELTVTHQALLKAGAKVLLVKPKNNDSDKKLSFEQVETETEALENKDNKATSSQDSEQIEFELEVDAAVNSEKAISEKKEAPVKVFELSEEDANDPEIKEYLVDQKQPAQITPPAENSLSLKLDDSIQNQKDQQNTTGLINSNPINEKKLETAQFSEIKLSLETDDGSSPPPILVIPTPTPAKTAPMTETAENQHSDTLKLTIDGDETESNNQPPKQTAKAVVAVSNTSAELDLQLKEAEPISMHPELASSIASIGTPLPTSGNLNISNAVDKSSAAQQEAPLTTGEAVTFQNDVTSTASVAPIASTSVSLSAGETMTQAPVTNLAELVNPYSGTQQVRGRKLAPIKFFRENKEIAAPMLVGVLLLIIFNGLYFSLSEKDPKLTVRSSESSDSAELEAKTVLEDSYAEINGGEQASSELQFAMQFEDDELGYEIAAEIIGGTKARISKLKINFNDQIKPLTEQQIIEGLPVQPVFKRAEIDYVDLMPVGHNKYIGEAPVKIFAYNGNNNSRHLGKIKVSAALSADSKQLELSTVLASDLSYASDVSDEQRIIQLNNDGDVWFVIKKTFLIPTASNNQKAEDQQSDPQAVVNKK